MRIGILGGGQLARMLALASYPFGLRFRCLDPSRSPSAADLMEHIAAPLDAPEGLEKLLAGVNRLTFETENIPAAALDVLDAAGVPYFPRRLALETAQDRWHEKRFLQAIGWPTAPFAALESLRDLETFAASAGFPLIIKTRRNGYDGKGQRVVRSAAELASAWEAMRGSACIAEGWVPFEAEGSLIAARSARGEVAFYPPIRNVHESGILAESELWPLAPALKAEAEAKMRATLERLDYVGVLTLEFFVCGGCLVANEMAPRVHNSGHWTIEAAVTSQFEQHIRAIAGWPLGSTEVVRPFRMLNLVGQLPPLEAALALPGVHYHSYRKDPAPGRKLGHITVLAPDAKALEERWQQLKRLTLSLSAPRA